MCSTSSMPKFNTFVSLCFHIPSTSFVVWMIGDYGGTLESDPHTVTSVVPQHHIIWPNGLHLCFNDMLGLNFGDAYMHKKSTFIILDASFGGELDPKFGSTSCNGHL